MGAVKLHPGTQWDAISLIRELGIEADGFEAVEEGHIPGLYIVFAIYEEGPLRCFVVHLGKGLIWEGRSLGFVFPGRAGSPSERAWDIHAAN